MTAIPKYLCPKPIRFTCSPMVSKNKELKESSNLLIVGVEVCIITEPSYAAFLSESLNYFASSLTKYDLSILCYTQFFFFFVCYLYKNGYPVW